MDAIDCPPEPDPRLAYLKQALRDKLIEHEQCVCKHGDDRPEIAHGRWGQASRVASAHGIASRVNSTGGDNGQARSGNRDAGSLPRHAPCEDQGLAYLSQA